MADVTTGHSVVPDAAAAPEVGKTPSHVNKVNNLAGDEKLCNKVLGFVRKQIEHFSNQEQRRKFADNTGTADQADRMYRVALNRDQSNSQTKDTLSKVTSTMFFRQIRTITANEIMIFLEGEELPAKYEAEVSSGDYTPDDGRDVAEQQQQLEQYTFDEDKRRAKIKRAILFNNKYGQAMLSIEWDRAEAVKIEKVATGHDGSGHPTGFTRKESKKVIRDWPTLILHDMKDSFFDAQIDDMDLQRVVGVRSQVSWESLASQQDSGQIMNLDKVGKDQLYQGENSDSDILDDRLTNADENTTTGENGLFDTWNTEAIIPIKENKNGKGGKWDLKTAPKRYWLTWVGDIKGGGAPVCVRFVDQMKVYNHGRSKYKLIHSLDDDKGAYHMGYASMLTSLYWQGTTNINQAIDNVTERNWAPLVANGRVFTSDLTYRRNKLIKIERNTELKRQEVPDTTVITLAMADRIENDADETTGANKPVQGQALGARTTATESKNVLDQALLPIDAKAQYVADQLFPWMFEIDAELWRQYGDPKSVISITHKGTIKEIKPAELWGAFKVKVTAVDRFRRNTIGRQEMNSFTQNVFPVAEKFMGDEGARTYFRNLFKIFKIPDGDIIFPEGQDFDAKSNAQKEDQTMIREKIFVEPQPGENQRAHLSVHEPTFDQYKLLPPDNKDPEVLRIGAEHIQIHRDFMKQESEQRERALAATTPQLEGEITGDRIAAEEGGAA